MKEFTVYTINKTNKNEIKFVSDYAEITNHPCMFFFKSKKAALDNCNPDEFVIKVKIKAEVIK
ncbi:MAG: hypothetical protein ABFD79_14685 [Phycisphaerales bacterium]